MKAPKAWKPDRRPAEIARLCSRVVVDDKGCWVWQGHRDNKGYGQIRIGRAMRWVHRFAFVTFVGEIPDAMTVNHKDECRNPSCCNPEHLELATRSVNTADGNRHRYRRQPVECS